VSSDTSRTDNHYGLFLLLLDDDGVVRSDGYFRPYPNAKHGYDLLVPEHPMTGFSPKGAKIPYLRKHLIRFKDGGAGTGVENDRMGYRDDAGRTDLVELNDDPGIDLIRIITYEDLRKASCRHSSARGASVRISVSA